METAVLASQPRHVQILRIWTVLSLKTIRDPAHEGGCALFRELDARGRDGTRLTGIWQFTGLVLKRPHAGRGEDDRPPGRHVATARSPGTAGSTPERADDS